MESHTSSYNYRGTIVESKEESDGVAWAAITPNTPLKKVFIKHPNLNSREVRINVLYSGICQSDVMVITQKYPGLGTFPAICGHEIIGEIYEIGSDVKTLKIGDKVGVGPIRECCENCSYCSIGNDNLCSEIEKKLTIDPWFGGFATSVQVPSCFVIKIPESIPLELAPPLMCAGGTVYAPLKRYAKPGKKCAIIGMGGLGHLAIQYSSKMGMKTYAISSSDNKKELIMKLGAHVFVNSNDNSSWENFIKQEIDVIINTSMTGDIQKYMAALKKGTGIFVQVGGPEENVKINIVDILMKELTLTGSAAASRSDLKSMLDFSITHDVKAICEMYNFEDFQNAFDRIANGKPEYRVVVKI